jgi:predicted permease
MIPVRVRCAIGGVVLLAVNAAVGFDPRPYEAIQRLGQLSSIDDILALCLVVAWICGGLFALAVIPENLNEACLRLITAVATGISLVFMGVALNPLSRPGSDPGFDLIVVCSITGAIFILLAAFVPERHRAKRSSA